MEAADGERTLSSIDEMYFHIKSLKEEMISRKSVYVSSVVWEVGTGEVAQLYYWYTAPTSVGDRRTKHYVFSHGNEHQYDTGAHHKSTNSVDSRSQRNTPSSYLIRCED